MTRRILWNGLIGVLILGALAYGLISFVVQGFWFNEVWLANDYGHPIVVWAGDRELAELEAGERVRVSLARGNHSLKTLNADGSLLHELSVEIGFSSQHVYQPGHNDWFEYIGGERGELPAQLLNSGGAPMSPDTEQ